MVNMVKIQSLTDTRHKERALSFLPVDYINSHILLPTSCIDAALSKAHFKMHTNKPEKKHMSIVDDDGRQNTAPAGNTISCFSIYKDPAKRQNNIFSTRKILISKKFFSHRLNIS